MVETVGGVAEKLIARSLQHDRVLGRLFELLARSLGTPRLSRRFITSGQYGQGRSIPDTGVLTQLAEAESIDGPLDWVVSIDFDNLAAFVAQAPTMPVVLRVDRWIGGVLMSPFTVDMPARAYRWCVRADRVRVSISQTGVGGAAALYAKAAISPGDWAEDTIEMDYSLGIAGTVDFNIPANTYAFRTLEATTGTDFRQRTASGATLTTTSAANSRQTVPLCRQAVVLRVFASTTASVGTVQFMRR